MKLPIADCRLPIDQARSLRLRRIVGSPEYSRLVMARRLGRPADFASSTLLRPERTRLAGGFTMIEIALCLAIIGFALVSILLVLPSGMNTQRQTREETIIGQDAAVLLEAIRDGAEGMDDLTNYVYAVTNYWINYKADGTINNSGVNGYGYTGAFVFGASQPYLSLTNGARIVGLLSTPEFVDGNDLPISSTFNTAYTSNHIVAYIRSLSGLAVEKPPQNNQIMQEDAFTYRLLCVNAPMAADTNVLDKASPVYSAYGNQLAGNLRELRLLFMWPQLPNGNVGGFRQTFRTSVAGQLLYNPTNRTYLYQSQSFTNAP